MNGNKDILTRLAGTVVVLGTDIICNVNPMFPQIAHKRVVPGGLRRGGRARGVAHRFNMGASQGRPKYSSFFLSCWILQVGLASVRQRGRCCLRTLMICHQSLTHFNLTINLVRPSLAGHVICSAGKQWLSWNSRKLQRIQRHRKMASPLSQDGYS